MSRQRGAAIVIRDNQILLMHRVNNGHEYYVFPGGGKEEHETIEQTVVRELSEETTLVIKPIKLIYKIVWDSGDENYFYLCDYVSGVAALHEDSEEFRKMKEGNQIFKPLWIDIEKLPNMLVYQLEIKDILIEDISKNFSDGYKELQLKVATRKRCL